MTSQRKWRWRARGRGPVVLLNREKKARMIDAVIADFVGRPIAGLRILDIGCGNGDISAYFARRSEQYAIDIADRRRVENSSLRFSLVNSEAIPFEDAFFDVVLSNHVVEHVPDQARHLDEIRRVLQPGGICYLATPNRTSPIMEGHLNNPMVLRHHQMAPLFRRHGFRSREYTVEVLRHPRRFHAEVAYAAWLPKVVLRALRPLYPSHIFILSPGE